MFNLRLRLFLGQQLLYLLSLWTSILTFKVYPRSNSFLQFIFSRVLNGQFNNLSLMGSNSSVQRSTPQGRYPVKLLSCFVVLSFVVYLILPFNLPPPSAPSSSSFYWELGASSAAISRASAGRPTSQMRGCWVFKSSTDTFISLFLILLVLNLVSTF